MAVTGGNTGMSYDWQKISGVATSLNSSLTTFRTQVEAIYSSITNMGANWSGTSYDAFKTYCDNYKKDHIDNLSSEIETWVNKLESLSEQAKATQDGNKNLFSA